MNCSAMDIANKSYSVIVLFLAVIAYAFHTI